MTELPPLDGSVLPDGIRARFVERANGLRVHILEAGEPDRPCLLLLHGFPELAYSWRKIMGRWPPPGITSSLPICAGTVTPPGGAPITTTICARSAIERGARHARARRGARLP